MSLDQDKKYSKMPNCMDVSPDPNGTVMNGCTSLKLLSDECEKLDAISECSSASSFVLSPDRDADLEAVFQNLVEMYQHQLKSIDDLDWDDNRKLQEKVKVLEDFVDQLLEQNEALVSTATELERETRKRVHQMESRLKKSARSTKDMRHQNSAIKVENGFLRDQNANLRHDLHALLHVIQQARSTGNWEMDWVTFCELSPEQVFGPIGTFSRIHSGESLAPTVSVHTPDDVACRSYCISERGSCGASNYSSYTNLQDPDCINRLQFENRHLQKLREQSQMELLEKDKIIANLESQITCLNQEIALHQLESERQFLIYRAKSLEESCKLTERINPGMLSSHGHSLPYFYHNDSCTNCGMRLAVQEKHDPSKPASSMNTSPSSSHQFPKFEGLPCSTEIVSHSSVPCVSSCPYTQNISSLLENTYVQTETSAIIHCGVQVEVKNSSVYIQTEEPKKTVDELVISTTDATHRKNMENLKGLLTRAEDKAASKEMLILQLQTHLQTSVREVQLKDRALENAENKLDLSRKECKSLKEKISDSENSILGLKQELKHELDVQKNLTENVEAREEKLREVKVLEQTLQDQKRRLLTQVDEQSEEIQRYQTELESVTTRLKFVTAEAELQKVTIQNLQEALIASKTASDSRTQPSNNYYSNAQNNIARRALSQSSILDI